MERELVILPLLEGLGDHLLFTPIPRIAKKSGYQKVYISSSTTLINPVYKHYVWECNPYIDGFKDAPPTFNLDPSIRRTMAEELHMRRGNIIDRILQKHGLDDNTLWHTPEVYFKTKAYEQFKDATIFDPSFISFIKIKNIHDLGLLELCKKKIKKWLTKNRVKIDYQITSSAFRNLYIEGFGRRLECSDFIEYSSIIKSCRSFYCLCSGSLPLSVALGKHPAVFYFPIRYVPSRYFAIQTKSLGRYLYSQYERLASLPLRLLNAIGQEIHYRTKPRFFKESTFITL